MVLAEPEKVLMCAVNMLQLVYLLAADPDKVEVKTGMAYELNAREHWVEEHFVLNQEHFCLEKQNCHFLELPAMNS